MYMKPKLKLNNNCKDKLLHFVDNVSIAAIYT